MSSPFTVCQVLAAPAGHEQLEVLGELMRQSHASYSRCGLGSGDDFIYLNRVCVACTVLSAAVALLLLPSSSVC